jgi:hypothetical protein
VNLFNEKLIVNQEWEFYLRLFKKDLKVNYINKNLFYIRRHQLQKSSIYGKKELWSMYRARKLIFSIYKDIVKDNEEVANSFYQYLMFTFKNALIKKDINLIFKLYFLLLKIKNNDIKGLMGILSLIPTSSFFLITGKGYSLLSKY